MGQPSGNEEERGFQALLEKVQAEVDAYGEQVTSLANRIDGVAAKLDSRFNELNEKLDAYTRTIMVKVDERFKELRRRAKP